MAAKHQHTRYSTSSHAAGTEIHLNKIAVATIRTIRKRSTERAGFQECKMGAPIPVPAIFRIIKV
jgi:hypothetical protein